MHANNCLNLITSLKQANSKFTYLMNFKRCFLPEIVLIFLSFSAQIHKLSGTIPYELYPNYHTIGISVRSSNYLTVGIVSQTFVSEKINGTWSNYTLGFDLCRVTPLYYAGCIFNTKPGTWYKIRSVLKSGATVVLDFTDSVLTRGNPKQLIATRTLFVSPTGSGIG
jgi:hypothetical protein